MPDKYPLCAKHLGIQGILGAKDETVLNKAYISV